MSIVLDPRPLLDATLPTALFAMIHESNRPSVAAAIPSVLTAGRDLAPAIRLVILDVGGPIVEDRGDVPAALRSALGHYGVASNPEEIARRRGASKREIVRYFVEQQSFPRSVDRDKLTASIYDEFTSNLLIAICRSVPPIAGAEDAFRQLRHQGYLLATTPGFDRAVTTSIFRRLGWEQCFAATICSDDVVQGRPSRSCSFTPWNRRASTGSWKSSRLAIHLSTCRPEQMPDYAPWWACSPEPLAPRFSAASPTLTGSRAWRISPHYSRRSIERTLAFAAGDLKGDHAGRRGSLGVRESWHLLGSKGRPRYAAASQVPPSGVEAPGGGRHPSGSDAGWTPPSN